MLAMQRELQTQLRIASQCATLAIQFDGTILERDYRPLPQEQAEDSVFMSDEYGQAIGHIERQLLRLGVLRDQNFEYRFDKAVRFVRRLGPTEACYIDFESRSGGWCDEAVEALKGRAREAHSRWVETPRESILGITRATARCLAEHAEGWHRSGTGVEIEESQVAYIYYTHDELLWLTLLLDKTGEDPSTAQSMHDAICGQQRYWDDLCERIASAGPHGVDFVGEILSSPGIGAAVARDSALHTRLLQAGAKAQQEKNVTQPGPTETDTRADARGEDARSQRTSRSRPASLSNGESPTHPAATRGRTTHTIIRLTLDELLAANLILSGYSLSPHAIQEWEQEVSARFRTLLQYEELTVRFDQDARNSLRPATTLGGIAETQRKIAVARAIPQHVAVSSIEEKLYREGFHVSSDFEKHLTNENVTGVFTSNFLPLSFINRLSSWQTDEEKARWRQAWGSDETTEAKYSRVFNIESSTGAGLIAEAEYWTTLEPHHIPAISETLYSAEEVVWSMLRLNESGGLPVMSDGLRLEPQHVRAVSSLLLHQGPEGLSVFEELLELSRWGGETDRAARTTAGMLTYYFEGTTGKLVSPGVVRAALLHPSREIRILAARAADRMTPLPPIEERRVPSDVPASGSSLLRKDAHFVR